jgi:hypothetical protein
MTPPRSSAYMAPPTTACGTRELLRCSWPSYTNGDIKEPTRHFFLSPSSSTSSASQDNASKDKELKNEGEKEHVVLESETSEEPLHHFEK